jgi:hypothetical protein
LDEPIAKFFLAGQFKGVPVALDNNYFVHNSFEGVTLKWQGGQFPYLLGNRFNNCSLELPERAEVPQDSEIRDKCNLVRKPIVSVEPTMVGSPIKWRTSACGVKKNTDGSMSITAAGDCPVSFIQGPSSQP